MNKTYIIQHSIDNVNWTDCTSPFHPVKNLKLAKRMIDEAITFYDGLYTIYDTLYNRKSDYFRLIKRIDTIIEIKYNVFDPLKLNSFKTLESSSK